MNFVYLISNLNFKNVIEETKLGTEKDPSLKLVSAALYRLYNVREA